MPLKGFTRRIYEKNIKGYRRVAKAQRKNKKTPRSCEGAEEDLGINSAPQCLCGEKKNKA